MFNIFYLQNAEGLAFGRQTSRRLKVLEVVSLQALRGELGEVKLPKSLPSRRADAIPIHPRCAVMMTGKTSAIIEVAGRDRPALLCDLGRVLNTHNLSINSAHVEVLGPKAIDVFYVALKGGASIDEKKLHDDLIAVLSGNPQ